MRIVLVTVAILFIVAGVVCTVLVNTLKDDDIDITKNTSAECLASGSCRVWDNGVCRVGKKKGNVCSYHDSDGKIYLFVACILCYAAGSIAAGLAMIKTKKAKKVATRRTHHQEQPTPDSH